MSVTKADVHREQLAHAETRKALEAARAKLVEMETTLKSRPTQSVVDDLRARLRVAANRKTAAPKEITRTVYKPRNEDREEIARLRAEVAQLRGVGE